MKNALASAKAVLANSKATQEEVNNAAAELQTAIDSLKRKMIQRLISTIFLTASTHFMLR